MDIKKEVKEVASSIKPATIIAACAVVVLAIVYAIVTGTTEVSHARNAFWALAGVLCLGEGIVLYVHSLVATESKLARYCGIAVTTLGFFWFFMDIVFNGGFDGHTRFGGWWISLIIAVVIGALLYCVPKFIAKKK